MCLKTDMCNYITIFRRPSLKITSYDTLMRTAEHCIYPYIGDKETDKLKTIDIMGLLSYLEMEKEYSFSTVKRTKELLDTFYEYAVKTHIAENNIVSSIKCVNRHRNEAKQVRAFSLDEVERFQKAALEKDNQGEYCCYYGPLLVVYLHTGLRLGELIAVSPQDYNPDTGEMYIHTDLARVNNYNSKGERLKGGTVVHQKSPKTYESNRRIVLNDTAKRLLYPYYLRAVRSNNDFIVVPAKSRNGCVSPSSVQHAFKLVAKKAQISNIKGIHTLRHTCATHMIKAGVDIKVVSKILGHASVKITYDTYYHLFDNEVPTALNVFDDIFNVQ